MFQVTSGRGGVRAHSTIIPQHCLIYLKGDPGYEVPGYIFIQMRSTHHPFQLKALERTRSASDDEQGREWTSKLKKCVVAAAATAAMNDDIGGESGGGGDGGCYLVKAASLDLDKNGGDKMKASIKWEVGVRGVRTI